MKTIRIATRNSPLALWQANFVKDRLTEVHTDLDVQIVGMTTKGDQLLDRSLATVGGKGLFLKELEKSLLDQETDIAVHSMKDVPVDLPKGLEIPVVCEREDPRDAMVSNNYQNLYALPEGAKVGTSSLRRVAQLKKAFPTLEFVELRGNVNTRLQKLDSGDYDAIILAAAGLTRLGFTDRIKQYISPELCLPAVGQGIVGIECRTDDETTKALIEPLHDKQSAIYLAAERAMNAALEGGCQVPVAGFAEVEKGKIRMRGIVGDIDGSQVLSSESTVKHVTIESAQALGQVIAEDLLKQGAGAILAGIYKAPVVLTKVEKPMVILTRQHKYLGNMPSILQRLDFQPTHIPTLKIEKNTKTASSELIQEVSSYTDIIFVSRNAVEVGLPMLEKFGGISEGTRVMAVGSETAKQLFRYGVDAMFPDVGVGADALLKVEQLQDLTDHKVLIVRGQVGMDWPSDVMRERGADVFEVKCYRYAIPEDSAKTLAKALDQNSDVDGVFIHSSTSLLNLQHIAGDHFSTIAKASLVCGSENIAETARELNWEGKILVAQSPANKHMMIAFSG